MSIAAAVLAALILGGPTLPQPTPAERLEQYVLEVNPGAEHAQELAERIMWEAHHYGLDPALFAAIGYLESRFRMYPHGGPHETTLAGLWQVYPTEAWLRHPRALRMAMSRSAVVSTGRAALILARHVQGGPHTPATYCRYNRTPCRRGYIVALYKAARKIRETVWPRTPSGPRPAH